MKYTSLRPSFRDISREGSPPGEVHTYQLSDEELIAMRLKMVHKSGLDRMSCIRRVAGGESLLQIERACNMKQNEIYGWVKKWGIAGINKSKAQEMIQCTESPSLPELAAPVESDGAVEVVSDQQQTDKYQATVYLPEISKRVADAIALARSSGYNTNDILKNAIAQKWSLPADVVKRLSPLHQVDIAILSIALQFGYRIAFTTEDKLREQFFSPQWQLSEMSGVEGFIAGMRMAINALQPEWDWANDGGAS